MFSSVKRAPPSCRCCTTSENMGRGRVISGRWSRKTFFCPFRLTFGRGRAAGRRRILGQARQEVACHLFSRPFSSSPSHAWPLYSKGGKKQENIGEKQKVISHGQKGERRGDPSDPFSEMLLVHERRKSLSHPVRRFCVTCFTRRRFTLVH